MFKNALVSVSDKTGLEDFLRPLADKGLRIVSSGGTARYLKERGFEVTLVSDQTQFPEVMGGRVKTLHPNIHMPLLQRADVVSDQETLAEHGLQPFDLLVVNLYPFAEALQKDLNEKEMVEFIDIGGPTLLRAAAKNFLSVSVVCDPQDYKWVNEKSELTQQDRKTLSAKVFRHVSQYDAMIANYLNPENPIWGAGRPHKVLRYGENPQQDGHWFVDSKQGIHEASILQGKELSYNNLLDLDASLQALSLFDEPTVVSVKHNNPCGVATATTIAEACEKSLAADPVSVFGGIIAFNRSIDKASASALTQLFLECIVAPGVDDEARDILASKKNLRVLIWPNLSETLKVKTASFRSLSGGYLWQSPDEVQIDSSQWDLVSGELSGEDRKGLEFSWKVCASLKSNAISITGVDQSYGLGMGQVNRVDAVEQALSRLKQFHPDQKNYYLASDAFFPFPDSIEKAAAGGVRGIVQPGGSVKDELVIAKAKELNIPMLLTGRRHFRH
ncbi:MAG: bifunctional phosphoribosylaminoimidazolecarboxamide formyltransferase/IMP cyclohydrolase [Pseudomonadota bacterium]